MKSLLAEYYYKDLANFSTNSKHLLTFHLFLGTHIIILGKNDDSYKLATSHIGTNLQFDNIPRDAQHDFAIENIDVNRLRRKVDELLLTQENTLKWTETRRAPFFHFYEGLKPYYQAETARVRRRIVDNMVQLLYMARYSVKRMQTSSYYTPTDSNFRMGYTYRTGQSHMKKMNLAYKTGLHNYKKWHNTTYHIVIHTKVVKNHLNYVYVYWVAVKIDNVMKEYKQIKKRVMAARLRKIREQEKQANHGKSGTKETDDNENDKGS